jgi:hypothetical protein
MLENRSLFDQRISFPMVNRPLFKTVNLFEEPLGWRVGRLVVVNSQNWLNTGIAELRVAPGARTRRTAENNKATHYRYCWLVRSGPGEPGWAINLSTFAW